MSKILLDDRSLISIISNSTKRIILKNLGDKPSSASNLAGTSNHTIQAIQPHIKDLETSGLIIKLNDGLFHNTNLGQVILLQLESLEFLSKNKLYFLNHDFGDIPPFLRKSFSLLSNSELIKGLPPNFTRWNKLVNDADNYVYCIFTQPPFLITEHILKKIPLGLDLKFLFGQNSIVPDSNDFVDKFKLKKLKSQDEYQKRICQKVSVNLLISDKEACLMLPFRNGETDIQSNFISSDINFHNWCLDFFNYKWNDAQPFARLRNS